MSEHDAGPHPEVAAGNRERAPATRLTPLWLRLSGLLLVLPLLAGAPSPARAGSSADTATEVEFLLNFARYVEWPIEAGGGASSSIRLCVLRGGLSYRMAREAARDRKVGGRRIVARSISKLEQAEDCHILFLPETQSESQNDVIRALADHSVFTVAESDGFAARGGIANFLRADGKIRFAINREAVGRAGLKVSSRLLRVARIVE